MYLRNEQTSWEKKSVVYDKRASPRLFIYTLLEFLVFRENVHHKRIGAWKKLKDIRHQESETDSLLPDNFHGFLHVVHRDDWEHWSKNLSIMER
jgi:hypothetical protein